MLRLILFPFLVALAALLGACSVLDSMQPDTKQLAVQYATLKVINGNPDKAARVVELVQEGRAFVEDGAVTVTVAALYDGVVERVNWDKLDPADHILVAAILTQARARMEEDLGVDLLDDAQRVKVLTVLDWIEAAASGYLPTGA